jgi:NAD(P)H-hydrate epimerase
MIYAVTAAQMRELDRMTIEDIGIPGVVLMETAGRRIAESIANLEHIDRRSRIAAVCGGGNNGGDGFVCARVLREAGLDAAVYLATPAAKIRGDAAAHLDAYRNAGGVVISIDTPDTLATEAASIQSADVVCDALFGTGLTREVDGHFARVIEVINHGSGAVVAADIPSGLSADTGHTLGVAVRADLTVTMAFAKIGLVCDPGFVTTGELRVVEIGIPRSLAAAAEVSVGVIVAPDVAGLAPPIYPSDHKGRRGHLLVIGGSPGKRGAGRLTARAGLRSGAGLVTLASAGPGEIAVPDPVMSISLDTEAAALDAIEAALAGRDAVAIGPGVPTGDWGRALVFETLAASTVPLVIDADALNHLTGELDRIARIEGRVVLTPHPGEAARLLGIGTAEVQADRLSATRALALRTGAVCVLKGARTVVCDGRAADSFATINTTGNPGMATAGSGDVLTGVIGALLAQDLTAADAARLGVFVHGLAGDHAASKLGARSLTASDLVDHLPAAFESL